MRSFCFWSCGKVSCSCLLGCMAALCAKLTVHFQPCCLAAIQAQTKPRSITFLRERDPGFVRTKSTTGAVFSAFQRLPTLRRNNASSSSSSSSFSSSGWQLPSTPTEGTTHAPSPPSRPNSSSWLFQSGGAQLFTPQTSKLISSLALKLSMAAGRSRLPAGCQGQPSRLVTSSGPHTLKNLI